MGGWGGVFINIGEIQDYRGLKSWHWGPLLSLLGWGSGGFTSLAFIALLVAELVIGCVVPRHNHAVSPSRMKNRKTLL